MIDWFKKWYLDRFDFRYVVRFKFPSRWVPGRYVEGKEKPRSKKTALLRARIGNRLYGDGSHWIELLDRK